MVARRRPDRGAGPARRRISPPCRCTVVDAASGEERIVAGARAWETSPRWLPDGSGLLVASDRDGWFQVVRVPLDGGDRPALTSGAVEHGDYNDGFGMAPLPSPDGDAASSTRCSATGSSTWSSRPSRPRRPPGAALAGRRSIVRGRPGPGVRINPIDGVWRAVDWLPDGSGILAIGASERDPEDFWILPVPAADGARARPRRLTRSLPAVVPVGGFVEPERLVIRARDGLPIPVTLWRPAGATGKRGGTERPDHRPRARRALRGRSSATSSRSASCWSRRGSPSCRSTSAARRATGATSAWPTAASGATRDVHDVIDAARWAAAQPWSNGTLAMFGGSYGGYLTLCALVEEPGDVGRRRGPVRRFGDRRELPPRRPVRPDRPPSG